MSYNTCILYSNGVLEMTNAIDDFGGLKWQLILCLLLAWIICFLCLLKGEDYSLTIKTLLNGFPVGQVTEKFNSDKLGSLLKKELTEDEDDKKEAEEEAPAGAQEEKEEDVEEEDDPNRLQRQEMEGKEEGEMKSENQERKKSENSDAIVAVENTEQEV